MTPSQFAQNFWVTLISFTSLQSKLLANYFWRPLTRFHIWMPILNFYLTASKVNSLHGWTWVSPTAWSLGSSTTLSEQFSFSFRAMSMETLSRSKIAISSLSLWGPTGGISHSSMSWDHFGAHLSRRKMGWMNYSRLSKRNATRNLDSIRRSTASMEVYRCKTLVREKSSREWKGLWKSGRIWTY